jgi:hypothetical protein
MVISPRPGPRIIDQAWSPARQIRSPLKRCASSGSKRGPATVDERRQRTEMVAPALAATTVPAGTAGVGPVAFTAARLSATTGPAGGPLTTRAVKSAPVCHAIGTAGITVEVLSVP